MHQRVPDRKGAGVGVGVEGGRRGGEKERGRDEEVDFKNNNNTIGKMEERRGDKKNVPTSALLAAGILPRFSHLGFFSDPQRRDSLETAL